MSKHNHSTMDMIMHARSLSEGSDNEEYIRGQAELIASVIAQGPEEYEEAIPLLTEWITKPLPINIDKL